MAYAADQRDAPMTNNHIDDLHARRWGSATELLSLDFVRPLSMNILVLRSTSKRLFAGFYGTFSCSGLTPEREKINIPGSAGLRITRNIISAVDMLSAGFGSEIADRLRFWVLYVYDTTTTRGKLTMVSSHMGVESTPRKARQPRLISRCYRSCMGVQETYRN